AREGNMRVVGVGVGVRETSEVDGEHDEEEAAEVADILRMLGADSGENEEDREVVLDPALEGEGAGGEGSGTKADGGAGAKGEEGDTDSNSVGLGIRFGGSEEEMQIEKEKKAEKDVQNKGEEPGESKTEDKKGERYGKQDWELPTSEWGMGVLHSMGGIGRCREGVSGIVEDGKPDSEEKNDHGDGGGRGENDGSKEANS
ncbi:MAG: hypothetical protein Q9174_006774, partial [Haloplaca sp. 1 TL-2023]